MRDNRASLAASIAFLAHELAADACPHGVHPPVCLVCWLDTAETPRTQPSSGTVDTAEVSR